MTKKTINTLKAKANASRRETGGKKLDALYLQPLPAKRTGQLYNAFPYPTKISPEAIALYIAAHTKPGDTVFDGFAGSGTTGLAALLCEKPTQEMKDEVKRLDLKVNWGARNAILYEVGALGTFVSKTLTNPPEPIAFEKAAREIVSNVEKSYGWMYEVNDPDGNAGSIRHVIWSDNLRCPSCSKKVKFWDSCVSRAPAQISSLFECPSCGHETPLTQVKRLSERKQDDLLTKPQTRRSRSVVQIYGVTRKKTWSRPATRSDLNLLKRINAEPLPSCVPNLEIPWGDLYRRGYHQGITHLHHFYTRRNLIVFGRLWEQTSEYKGTLRDALRFWLLSYNAAHATLMTRVVAKAGQDELVVTSGQPGVLYISGLPVEKNLFAGVKRKLSTISKAFALIHGSKGRVQVFERSSCEVSLRSGSIDYVFTDPPFGGNIPYAEVNFINEAWLRHFTERTEEAIVSPSQNKAVEDYQELLAKALGEAQRILKPSGKATLVFHSATAAVWNALQSAYTQAGFTVECSGVLDKTQGSFKQVTTKGYVRGDPILRLGKASKSKRRSSESVWKIAEQLLADAALMPDRNEQTPQRLYSRLVNHFLANHQPVPVDAETFYDWHRKQLSMEFPRAA